MELEKICLLNERLISRVMVRSVKEESDQALVASLWRTG
jgi:hypothetical protein